METTSPTATTNDADRCERCEYLLRSGTPATSSILCPAYRAVPGDD